MGHWWITCHWLNVVSYYAAVTTAEGNTSMLAHRSSVLQLHKVILLRIKTIRILRMIASTTLCQLYASNIILQTWLAHISHREQMRRLRSCTGRLQLSVRQSWLTVWSFLAAVTGATWCHWFCWCFVCRNTWQAKIKVVASMERNNNTAWKYTFIYVRLAHAHGGATKYMRTF